MSDPTRENKAPVPAVAEPDGPDRLLDTLEQKYALSLLPTDLATIQEMGFELLPQDQIAHISGALQQIPGLLHGESLQNAYQETYAEAYRLLIPEGCSNASKMEIQKLTEEFGPNAESMEFLGPDGKVKRHGGVQKIDPPDIRAQQIAYLAFSAASVATSQYFLYRIDKKLEAIESTTADILQFLELDKQAKLQGYYEYLSDSYSRLHSIMEDDRRLQATLQQIQTIKADTLGSIRFYQEKIQNELTAIKTQIGKQIKQAPEQIVKARSSLSAYWLALFVYEFAEVLEILLTRNTADDELRRIQQKLSEQIAEYEQAYRSYRGSIRGYGLKISMLSEKGVPLHVAAYTTAVALLGRTSGEKIYDWMLPILPSYSSKENSINAAEALYAPPDQIHPDQLGKIADSIGELNKLYNGPVELAVSGRQLYIRPLNGTDAGAGQGPEDGKGPLPAR